MKKLRLAGLLALAILVAACAPKRAEGPDPAFAEYVSAYTGGIVGDGTPIRIELNAPVSPERQTGDLFRFKPALPGETRWLSPTVVEYVPEAWKEGTVYQGTFRLGQVADVRESAFQEFPFSIQVAPKVASLTLDGITIREDATLQGSIQLSAPAAPEDIELTVDPSCPVTLTGQGTGYRFETGGIARDVKDKTVTLKLKVAGFKDVQPLKAVIPAAGNFKVFGARIERGGNPHVTVVFSEPLDASAAREGFLELSGIVRQTVDVKDNVARIYFEGEGSDPVGLTVHRNVSSASGLLLDEDFHTDFSPEDPFPAVQIPLDGNILPDEGRLILPFRAVNLSAVDLRIIKVYENNVLMFLQDNDLNDTDLRRSGRIVYSRQIPLAGDATRNLHVWNDYSVDLTGLFKQEPGAIYHLRLSFKKEYSLYGGKEAPTTLVLADGKPSAEEDARWDRPSYWWYSDEFDYSEYDWDDRNNPATPSYYINYSYPSVNLISSNLGLLAQYADGNRLWASVTDLMSAKPLAGVELEAYDYQLQRVGKAKTDGKGLADFSVTRKPFVLLARKGRTTGYLRLSDGYEKSMSRFDVGGETVSKGLKGFIYGERGVWRPGDTLHVTMILADKAQRIPEGHPASLELYTPEGQFYTRLVATGQDGFYAFPVATSADDPTGVWNAYVKVGGTAFHKSLRVETVKPNRLKVKLDLPGDVLQGGTRMQGLLSSSWLTGVPASGLRAHASMTLGKGSSTFPGFDGYIFRNPASTFEPSEHELFRTTLSAGGTAQPVFDLPAAENAPSLLSAFIVTSVEESGGDESFTTQTVPYSPFPAYVGVKFPADGELETGKDHPVQVAVVDAGGRRLAGRKLEYRVFKLDWSWWWEASPYDLQGYVNGSAARAVASGNLTSGMQDVTFNLRAEDDDWGRYLVVVRDLEGGHLSGKVVTLDWPAYRGRADRKDPSALTLLSFSADKDVYRAGEKATVYIPAAEDGQALVSLENTAGVISREWVATQAGKDTPYTFTITPEMAPNFYVHITLVLPYGASAEGQPLRLFGAKRLKVENPASHLEPVVKVADTVAPEEAFTVNVSEKSGKPMTYTLAVVDEGLLDLTAFKTPSPWDAMYRTEALGVRTWDLYDQVIGAYGGRFSQLLSIGGDEENIRAARKDNRFNPVVKFLGPFTLKKGTATHRIELPMYVGSLRVMVVAGHDGAYGNAEKTVTVKAPLMVLSTLPRQVCAGEDVVLPVNVFALEGSIRNAQVSVKAEGALALDGTSTTTATFGEEKDAVVRFALKATGEGPAKVTVTAQGASHKASETIDIQVLNPNPETVKVVQQSIPAGKEVSFEAGDGSTLELAGFPAVNTGLLFKTMKDYPYNCSEQLSARGLTLLHLLPQLSEADAATAKELIPDIIRQLYGRQRSDGGFTYWSGGTASDSWVSSMAGQFLSEASAAGFEVQPTVLGNWSRFQNNLSQAYRLAGNAAFSQLDECYRLYTLAVAGNPSQGAMNRLKESAELDSRAAMMLAAAYAAAGKTKQAGELVTKTREKEAAGYDAGDFTYGTPLRDQAVSLLVLTRLGNIDEALGLAKEMASRVNQGWISTQEAAFVATAMDGLRNQVGSQGVKAVVGGQEVISAKSVYTQAVQGTVPVKNTSESTLWATLSTVSRAPAGTPVPATANGLQIQVTYLDGDGAALKPASIPQGTEFSAIVKVTNPTALDYKSLALTERVPSGWEIRNDRLLGIESENAGYRDIRDDRCSWFFDLPHGASRTFTLKLRAAYEGSYTLPAVTCSAMYDASVSANTASSTTAVTR